MFESKPECVMIVLTLKKDQNNRIEILLDATASAVFTDFLTESYAKGKGLGTNSYYDIFGKMEGNNLFWYNSNSYPNQFNIEQQPYYYLAFFKD